MDTPDQKPATREYARARLAELKEMLAAPKSGVNASMPPADAVSTLPDYLPYQGTAEQLIRAFEDTVECDGTAEYWSARKLMPLLGYGNQWNIFEKVVASAEVACHQSGNIVEEHFSNGTVMTDGGTDTEQRVRDIRVTRYGAYLISLNGHSRNKQVAFAQTYFAVQARRQEIGEMLTQQQMTEVQRRVMLRDEMAMHNKKLVSAAREAGVETNLDFAVFQNHGYRGLYGGRDRRGIQEAKGLPEKSNILDHMGSTELAANHFRATQTEEKLRREAVQGKANANTVHHAVGLQVRKAIADIGGTMPEKLVPAEDINQLRRRLTKPSKLPELE